MFYAFPHTYKTADFKELFSEAGASRWAEAWRNTDVLSIYGNSVLPWWRKRRYPELNAAGHFMDDAALHGMGRWLQARDIALCIEVGAVKAWSLDAVSARTRTEEMLGLLQRCGCNPASIRIDESLFAGLKHGRTVESVVYAVAQNFCRPLYQAHDTVAIGIVEPWPACAAVDIVSYVAELGERGALPAFVHIDINYPRVGVIGSVPDLARALETVSSLHIPIGIIAWSSNFHRHPSSNADYCRNTLDFAAWMHGHLDRFCVDHIVQSWLPYPTHCLPEDREETFMWLVREYGRRHVRGWDCRSLSPIV